MKFKAYGSMYLVQADERSQELGRRLVVLCLAGLGSACQVFVFQVFRSPGEVWTAIVIHTPASVLVGPTNHESGKPWLISFKVDDCVPHNRHVN